MRTGFDSAYPPTPAQIAAAKAAGISAWSGYFAGPGILNGWSDANFHAVMDGGLATSAYCSGWADPVAMKTRAGSLGIPIILDDESGIRSLSASISELVTNVSENRRKARQMMHGGEARPVTEWLHGEISVSSWVQPWLDASGAGQYGNQPVFAGVRASRYVFAAYPGGDPGLSWPSYYPRPGDGHPCGWQYQGTHAFSGIGVDSTHYDDSFWTFGPDPHPVEEVMLTRGPIHKLAAPVTLKSYVAGSYYSEPFASMVAGAFNLGATSPVDYYVYSSTPVQSPNLGNGQAGPDSVFWHSTRGGWIPDAILVTIGIAGLTAPGPNVPANEPVDQYYIPGSGGFAGRYISAAQAAGLSMADVDTEIAGKIQGLVTSAQVNAAIDEAIAALPVYATKEEVAAAILQAVQAIPAVKAGPHHHSVLGLINTGPVIPDPA